MNELGFLKNIYNLHGHHVEWAIIEETVRDKKQKAEDPVQMLLTFYLSEEKVKDEYDEERTLKLGLFIKGSRVYVDLFARRFFSTVNLDMLERKVYPARRVSCGDGNVAFEAKEDTSKYLVFSKTFLQDIYGVTQYGEWMEERLLL